MCMLNPTYRGFWGIQTGQTVVAIADFLSWDKSDWLRFTSLLDELEKKDKRRKRDKNVRQILRERMYKLIRRGAIKTKIVDGQVLIRLTDDGWRFARANKIRSITVPCRGGYCLVTFDIPERYRRARNSLRRFLKQCGFEQLHKSVWAHRRDVTSLVVAVIRDLKLTPWVTVIEGKLIESAFE